MRIRTLSVSILTASLAIGSTAVLRTAIAADKDKENDTRKERMEHDKWTNADRARDALDHLKKARAQLENVTNDKTEGDAGKALEAVKTAISEVDSYLAAVDKAKK